MVNNAVDVGVRVELPAPVFAPLTDKLYESKLVYYSPTFGDEVRTFCMNPNGEVVQENYNGIATVNGNSYANIKNGELFIYNLHISSYEFGNIYNKDPLRDRKLLITKRELNKLFGLVKQKGYSLVPISLYFKGNFVKVELRNW